MHIPHIVLEGDEEFDEAEKAIRENERYNKVLQRVRSHRVIHNHPLRKGVGQKKCVNRRRVRSLCENFRDQYLSRSNAKEWEKPAKGHTSKHPHAAEITHKYRKNERRKYGEYVYTCTETHTSNVYHPFNPLVESSSVHHRKPKWIIDRSCTSTWFATTLHVTVMIIIIASVVTFILDSENSEYCKNLCPTFHRADDGTIYNCSLFDEDNANLATGGCNPHNNTRVACDKSYSTYSILSNPSTDYYCTYHKITGNLDDDQILAFDLFFTVVFTLELLVRAVVAESYCVKSKSSSHPSTPFFADGLNWCDFLAILPLPIQLLFQAVGIDNSLRTEALDSTESSASGLSTLAILLELFKLLRVIRVFKIARHFSGTKVMSKTIQKSFRPIRLTIIVLFLIFTVVGSILMLAEPCFGAPGTDECQFPDLFTAGYFLMITILTVGYGDHTPKTDLGRLIGILCMILGSCFLAMPLAIVGNKFQAAYDQEQAESSRHNEENDDNVTKQQRRQRLLNEGVIMLGTIDYLQRISDGKTLKKATTIGSMYKTHLVMAKDMAAIFPALQSHVEHLQESLSHQNDDDDDDDNSESTRSCCRKRTNGVKVAPIGSVNTTSGEEEEVKPKMIKKKKTKDTYEMSAERQRTEAEESGKCRDKLWLCMEVHDSSKCAMAGYVIRFIIVIFGVLGCSLMMFHELNLSDEMSEPCQRVAYQWCQLIHDLPEEWVYVPNTALDVSGRFDGYNKTDLLAANPICSRMTCTNGLVCTDDWNNDSMAITQEYAGCTYDSCFDNGNAFREPVKCPTKQITESDPVTTLILEPSFSVATETSTSIEYETRNDYFDSSALSMVLMWDETPVCERLVCQNNTQFYWMGTLSQDDVNFLFGIFELFLCCWFVGEFVLRLVSCRSCASFFKNVANWMELACTVTAMSELAVNSIYAQTLYYEVWDMPLFVHFAPDHVRPLRIIVALRFVLMARSYSGAYVLKETFRKALPKLAIPLFFLVIILVIAAGLYFTFETQMDCHVEKVQRNLYDPDAETFEYVRDLTGERCDLQGIGESLWLTIVTLTSVGYGRYYPRNVPGQILSFIVAVTGAFYMAMPLAIVGTTFYSEYKMQEESRARIHVKRKFKNAVGMVRSFIRQGKLDANSNASADTLHTHAGLYDDELQVLADYVQTLGPPDLFEADRETLQTLRTKHVTVMNILGHMLATPELDDLATKGMFG